MNYNIVRRRNGNVITELCRTVDEICKILPSLEIHGDNKTTRVEHYPTGTIVRSNPPQAAAAAYSKESVKWSNFAYLKRKKDKIVVCVTAGSVYISSSKVDFDEVELNIPDGNWTKDLKLIQRKITYDKSMKKFIGETVFTKLDEKRTNHVEYISLASLAKIYYNENNKKNFYYKLTNNTQGDIFIFDRYGL